MCFFFFFLSNLSHQTSYLFHGVLSFCRKPSLLWSFTDVSCSSTDERKMNHSRQPVVYQTWCNTYFYTPLTVIIIGLLVENQKRSALCKCSLRRYLDTWTQAIYYHSRWALNEHHYTVAMGDHNSLSDPAAFPLISIVVGWCFHDFQTNFSVWILPELCEHDLVRPLNIQKSLLTQSFGILHLSFTMSHMPEWLQKV